MLRYIFLGAAAFGLASVLTSHAGVISDPPQAHIPIMNPLEPSQTVTIREGVMSVARLSSEADELIRCRTIIGPTSSGGAEFMLCIARKTSITNHPVSVCFSYDAKMVNAARAITPDSLIQFGALNNDFTSQCTFLSVQQSSEYRAKQFGP